MPPRGETGETLVRAADAAAAAYGLDAVVLYALFSVESAWNTTLSGRAGEVGIGQFMAATWRGVVEPRPELPRKVGLPGRASERVNVISQI